MSSRFNTLYLGDPAEAAEALDDHAADPDELRIALINALKRIGVLERQQRDKLGRLTEVARMVVEEYYGDGGGDWQSVAREAKKAIE